MKKYVLYVLCSLMVMGMVSCQNKKKTRDERVAEFRQQLTAEDTTAMLSMCDAAMEELKAKRIDKVLASMFQYNDSTGELKPLDDNLMKQYKRQFTLFPVLEYHRKYFSFQHEGCNDVKYEVVFATAEAAGTEEPAKTAYMFNPVKVDGDWKLCVKTASDEIDPDIR